jgi:hypothetical protein
VIHEAPKPAYGLARRLSGIELRDWQGVPRRLGELWQHRPVVLVFIRHFG